MSNFGTKKLVGALALAVAAIGIGTAVQTGAPAQASIIPGHGAVDQSTHTYTIKWIRLDGTKISTFTFTAKEGDHINFDKVEIPSGYRVATPAELNKAGISYVPSENFDAAWTTSIGEYSTTVYAVSTAKVVKADYNIPYKGVVKTKKATNVYTFGSNYALKKGKALKKSSSWKTSYLLSVKGALYYGVGGGQWVKASDVAIQKIGVGHVNYNKHYGIQIWNAKHGIIYDKYGKARKLKGQTNWKVFGTATIKGKKYYNLGINQFMEAKYVSLHK
jgi:hypothetical protein